jgi:hypothetical protein
MQKKYFTLKEPSKEPSPGKMECGNFELDILWGNDFFEAKIAPF